MQFLSLLHHWSLRRWRRQPESKHDVLAVTSSNWFLLVIVHDKRRWFKLVVSSSNWFFLVVQTGCDQLKLVLTACWNWLKLVLTRGDGSNWQWPARTSSSLLLTSSKWFFLVVETDWLAQTSSHKKRRWFKLAELVLPCCWNWLWLPWTVSSWLLCMTSKYMFTEKVFSLPPARNHQVNSKSFMAHQAEQISINSTQCERCKTETYKRIKLSIATNVTAWKRTSHTA